MVLQLWALALLGLVGAGTGLQPLEAWLLPQWDGAEPPGHGWDSRCAVSGQTTTIDQLLSAGPTGKGLIECGSLLKGVCALHALSSLGVLLSSNKSCRDCSNPPSPVSLKCFPATPQEPISRPFWYQWSDAQEVHMLGTAFSNHSGNNVTVMCWKS